MWPLRVHDLLYGTHIVSRATILQQKTGQPVRFEVIEHTRDAVLKWINKGHLRAGDYLFPSRINRTSPISTRQYARIVKQWVSFIGLDPYA